MKHTPGPWKIKQFKGGALRIISDDTHICTVHHTVPRGALNEEERRRREANARLIAAAPKMIESLKEILAALNRSKTYPADPEYMKGVAQTAIAEATGKEV
jgi:hypothetical protein